MKKAILSVTAALLFLTGCGTSADSFSATVSRVNGLAAEKDTTFRQYKKTHWMNTEEEKEEDKGKLDFADFADFDDIIANGVPESAEFPAVKYAEGEWKYYLRINYTEATKSEFYEIGYTDLKLNYDTETMILTLHPRLASDGYEIFEETDEEINYEPFEGGWAQQGGFLLEGNSLQILIEYYFADSGREYIMGTVYRNDTVFGDMFLLRGQN